MTDVAELGLSVKSDQVATATDRNKKFAASAGVAETATEKLTKAALKLVAAYATWRIAEAVIQKFIISTVEAEKVQAQLAAALKSTAGASGQTIDSLNAHAQALQRVTMFGDEAINSAQSLLLTFTQISGETFPRATEAVLDMATAMGTDLKSAAIQVGKALNDPILGVTALQRSGIQFSESQKEMIKGFVETNQLATAQGIILKELETQFGGSAAAARDTLGGAIAALDNAFGDLFEATGSKSLAFRQSIENVTKILSDPKTQEAIQTFGGWLFDAISGAVNLITGLVKAIEDLLRMLDWLNTHDMFGNAKAPSAQEIARGRFHAENKLREELAGGNFEPPNLSGFFDPPTGATPTGGAPAALTALEAGQALFDASRESFEVVAAGASQIADSSSQIATSAQTATQALLQARGGQLQQIVQLNDQYRSGLEQFEQLTQRVAAAPSLPVEQLFGDTADLAAAQAEWGRATTQIQFLFDAFADGQVTATDLWGRLEGVRGSLLAMEGAGGSVNTVFDNLVKTTLQTILLGGQLDTLRNQLETLPNRTVYIDLVTRDSFTSSQGGTMSSSGDGVTVTRASGAGGSGGKTHTFSGSGPEFDAINWQAFLTQRMAVGGPVSGPGTGTSDSILSMLSNGEYVINAQAASQHRALLDAINGNRLRGFAWGGLVDEPANDNIGSRSSILAAAASGSSLRDFANVNILNSSRAGNIQTTQFSIDQAAHMANARFAWSDETAERNRTNSEGRMVNGHWVRWGAPMLGDGAGVIGSGYGSFGRTIGFVPGSGYNSAGNPIASPLPTSIMGFATGGAIMPGQDGQTVKFNKNPDELVGIFTPQQRKAIGEAIAGGGGNNITVNVNIKELNNAADGRFNSQSRAEVRSAAAIGTRQAFAQLNGRG